MPLPHRLPIIHRGRIISKGINSVAEAGVALEAVGEEDTIVAEAGK